MNISVVIPLLNEEESLPELHSWIKRVMNANNFSYEVVFVDDGSKDNSWSIIEQLKSQDENVKGIKFQRNYGKSAALQTAFAMTSGDVVITMDADLQDSPDEIPELYRMIMEDDLDLVSGWKKKRYDPLTKTIPTKLYNGAARLITGIRLHDFNCGLKAYKSAVIKSIEIYGDMHRYIPPLAKYAGFTKIGEKVVEHQARKYGVSKFGLNRFLNGSLDLMTVAFMGKFGKKPMHFFGALGVLMFFLGSMFSLWLIVQKLFFNPLGRLISERAEFYIALSGHDYWGSVFSSRVLGRNVC